MDRLIPSLMDHVVHNERTSALASEIFEEDAARLNAHPAETLTREIHQNGTITQPTSSIWMELALSKHLPCSL